MMNIPGDTGANRGILTWIARAVGLALSLLALGYVAYQAAISASTLERDFLTREFIAAIVVASVIYSALGMVIALAWHILVASTGSAHLRLRDSLRVFGRSQVLKYLPTNVLHYAGRHAAAYRMGVSHKALIWASVAEGALVLAAAALTTAIFARPLFARVIGALDAPNWMQLLVPFAAAVVLIAVNVILVRSHAEHQGIVPMLKGSAVACVLYALFFLANGFLLAWLVVMLPTTTALQQPPWELAGIVALAWFAGFIVPGAPAGIGIREFVLTLGLEQAGLAESAVTLAIAYRIITLLGDLLLAIASTAFLRTALSHQKKATPGA
jgi:hypothetical protein